MFLYVIGNGGPDCKDVVLGGDIANGHSCEYYTMYPEQCGTLNFNSTALCCACKGKFIFIKSSYDAIEL